MFLVAFLFFSLQIGLFLQIILIEDNMAQSFIIWEYYLEEYDMIDINRDL